MFIQQCTLTNIEVNKKDAVKSDWLVKIIGIVACFMYIGCSCVIVLLGLLGTKGVDACQAFITGESCAISYSPVLSPLSFMSGQH